MRVTVLYRTWLVATGMATALVLPAMRTAAQSPAVESAQGIENSPAAALDAGRGRALLREAQQALEQGNTPAAIARFRQAAALAGPVAELRGEVNALGQRLLAAGVDPQQLRPAPAASPTPGPFQLPGGEGAAPLPSLSSTAGGSLGPNAPLEQRKAEALRLVAAGRAALDRGDAALANQLVRQATALQVPENAFAPGEPRVWQLMLDAEAAARRQGVAPAGGAVQADGNQPGGSVMQAGGPLPPGGVAQVQNAQAQNDASLGPLSLSAPPAGAGAESPAEAVYQRGIQALADGDRRAARELFLEAWQSEAEMPAELRQRVKDKLTLLQPEPLPRAAGPGGAPAIDAADQQQQLERQRMYREVSSEMAAAEKIRVSEPLSAMDRIQKLRRRVSESNVDPAAKQQLLAMVDRAISAQQKYITEHRAMIDLEIRNEQVRADIKDDARRRREVDDKIAEMVENFNKLMDDRRYAEAEVLAKQVGELDPGSPIATLMFHKSRLGTRLMMNEDISRAKEQTFAEHMMDVERSATAPDPSRPMHMPEARDWTALSARRLGGRDDNANLSSAELEIRRRMTTKVEAHFIDRPLSEVLKTLETITGVPIWTDHQALTEQALTSDAKVTLDLSQPISLRSALELLLSQYDLTWMIQDEVLKITSRAKRRANVVPRTYKVADLVTPIPNYVSSYHDGMAGALRAAQRMTRESADVRVMPVSAMSLAGGPQSQSTGPMNPNLLAQYSDGSIPLTGGAGALLGSQNGRGGSAGGGAMADFGSLMELIQTTIAPDTWEELGGPSTMAPYPQNLSLIISTTTDVHEQIADLLNSLRRLMDLQVTIEVRFITLSDNFFERIGVDFDVSIDDGVRALPGDDRGSSVKIGLATNVGQDGIPTPTADFDIKFNQNSFGVQPQFGGFDPGTAGRIGFAILSDIEAFFFLEAAQGDQRTNILQAPKVTLFDGQMANINDTTQRPFVMSITPVVADFAVAQQPVIVVLSEGTQLNVQAVVSSDKRFVRLSLTPYFSQIGNVDTFTFQGRSTTRSRSNRRDEETGEIIDDDEEETINEGTTVQLPTLASTSVGTTVSVPDGGTILLGGIKRLAEGRTERGIPMLSKIPYVSRLFRNVAIGRDARSLMLMVTPRIIIQEEEELAQTGFDSSLQ